MTSKRILSEIYEGPKVMSRRRPFSVMILFRSESNKERYVFKSGRTLQVLIRICIIEVVSWPMVLELPQEMVSLNPSPARAYR